MPARTASILTTVVLVLLLGAVNAQTAPPTRNPGERTLGYYRCGPDGLDLRDSPCPDGQGQALALPQDKVDAKDAAAARKRTADESRELAARQRNRERVAANTAPAGAAGIDGDATPRGAKAPSKSTIKGASNPSKPKDPKRPKPKDPKPKKKPKLPKSPTEPTTPR